MFLEPKTDDQASEGVGSSTSLLIQTINTSGQYVRRKRWLRYIALGVFISSRSKKTRLPHEAPTYEPLEAPAPPAPAFQHAIDIPLQDRFLNKVGRIVREKNLNALRGLGGVAGILPLLSSHFEVASK